MDAASGEAAPPKRLAPLVWAEFAIQQLCGSKRVLHLHCCPETWRFDAINTRALSAAPCLGPCLAPCRPSWVVEAVLPLMCPFLSFYLDHTGLWDAVGLQLGGGDFHTGDVVHPAQGSAQGRAASALAHGDHAAVKCCVMEGLSYTLLKFSFGSPYLCIFTLNLEPPSSFPIPPPNSASQPGWDEEQRIDF